MPITLRRKKGDISNSVTKKRASLVFAKRLPQGLNPSQAHTQGLPLSFNPFPSEKQLFCPGLGKNQIF